MPEISSSSTPPYTAPSWLPDRHSQTIWPALFTPRPKIHYRRERWETPDGDFIDVDLTDDVASSSNPGTHPGTDRPLLIVFHGLEGNSASPYAVALMAEAMSRGWR